MANRYAQIRSGLPNPLAMETNNPNTGLMTGAQAFTNAAKPDWSNLLQLAKTKAASKPKLGDLIKGSNYLSDKPEAMKNAFSSYIEPSMIAPRPIQSPGTELTSGTTVTSKTSSPLAQANLGSQIDKRNWDTVMDERNYNIAVRAADRGDWDLVNKIVNSNWQNYDEAWMRNFLTPGSVSPTPPRYSSDDAMSQFLDQFLTSNGQSQQPQQQPQQYEPPPIPGGQPKQQPMAPQGHWSTW